ncbi:prenyltransferase [Ectothiorhodospiraceae bacterium BW-2]|nr:prenyltransferase [Ectothiorhodospiraceae bacterium BW-2]
MAGKKTESSPTLWGVMRLPFLPLALVSVLQAVVLVESFGYRLNFSAIFLVTLLAVAAHIAVNVLNEVDDFTSGLDKMTQRTPFSGGSGTLPARPELLPAANYLGWGAVAVTVVLGLWFVLHQGWPLLVIGAVGLALIVLYSRYLTRSPWLCLLAPGIGFGPVIVLGTTLLLTGAMTVNALLLSLITLFLVSNLLLLNQYPDIEADRAAGRYHLLIAYGTRTGAQIYTLLMGLAYATLLYAIVTGRLPLGTLLGLVTLPLALSAVRAVWRWHEEVAQLQSHLWKNVVVVVGTPLLISAGFWF